METYSDTLGERLEAAEQKSKRIEDAKNTRERLSRVTDRIERVRRKLDAVEQKATKLSFYVGVLEEVFNGSRSDCVGLTGEIKDAQQKASISDDDIVTAAEEQAFAEYLSELDEAKEHLDSAISTVRGYIRTTYVEDYKDELSSARELNSIISDGDDTFVSHIETMQSFIGQDIRNTDRSVSTLASRWDKMQTKWQRHSEKQSWEHFQQKHGLSETTVVELQQFSEQDVVKLSDLSMNTIQEVKQVDELESALEVSLQT
jgi:hypothetical protein